MERGRTEAGGKEHLKGKRKTMTAENIFYISQYMQNLFYYIDITQKYFWKK